MKTKTENYFEIFEQIDFAKIKDHPNILIAAGFWDDDRYCAAKTCYRFLREIDDFVDNYKSEHGSVISEDEKERMISSVYDWIKKIQFEKSSRCLNSELTEVLEKFQIPLWPMEVFARSMIYDIQNDGFRSINSFLDYAQGASVAPASIFVHLCGIRRINGHYMEPIFDIREAATPCAVFSYLVHIIRDFQADQKNNLNYFADELIKKYGLNRMDLREMADGSKVKQGFRDMIREYLNMADKYRQETVFMLDKISPHLAPRYKLSLHIIFNLYLMVYERIDVNKGNFSMEELNPTADEIRERVYQTILEFQEKEE
jgi:phytoene/squalene synthetase